MYVVLLVAMLAQDTPERILVDKNDLPPSLLKEIESKQKMEKYSEYTKWGREIGVAVNETLGAVTDHTVKFSNTNVGKLAVFLVAWKVVGKDFVRVVVGIPLLAIHIAIVLWSYRKNCVARRVLKELKPDRTKIYEIYDPTKNRAGDVRIAISVAHVFVFVLGMIIGGLVIFV